MTKVLVVEDEADIRDLLVDTLVDGGFDVVSAEDGGRGLEMVTRERPDVVPLDVWMPVMDGFHVLERLREDAATRDVPVILLTAMPAWQGEAAGNRLGVKHYLSKRFDPGLIVPAVNVALREAKVRGGEQGKAGTEQGRGSSDAKPEKRGQPGGLIGTKEMRLDLGQQFRGGVPLGTVTFVEGGG